MLINYRTAEEGSVHDNNLRDRNSQYKQTGRIRKRMSSELKICLIIGITLFIFSFLICFIAFVIIPVLFMFSIQFQRFAMFPSIRDLHSDFDNANLYGIKGVRNLYLSLNESDNIVLGVWHLLPDSAAVTLNGDYSLDFEAALKNKSANVVLYFHGNSGNRISPLPIYHVLRRFFHIIAFDYRGYGDSTSVPSSEEVVVNDSVEIYKWLRNKTEGKLFVWGHSLGAALATHTLAKLDCQGITPYGLFLEAPFNNMAEEVIYHPMGKIFSWLPWFNDTIISPLKKNGFKFETDKKISSVNCPILILNAEDDNVVPTFLVRKLVGNAEEKRNLTYQGPIFYHEFPKKFGYGHHRIFKAPDLPNLIRGFMENCKDFAKV